MYLRSENYNLKQTKMRKILLLIALFCPLMIFAQKDKDIRIIKGEVLDSITKEPLIGATVFIDPEAVEAKISPRRGRLRIWKVVLR